MIMNDHYEGKDLLYLLMKHNVPFIEGNIIKYVFRWQRKGGVADLKKALDYLQELIKEEEKKEINTWTSINTNLGLAQPLSIPEQEATTFKKSTISCSALLQNQEKWQGS